MMPQDVGQRLTLARPATYEIKVPGFLPEGWSDFDGKMTAAAEIDEHGLPFTTLTGTVDQAALQGVLRRLYALGLPLIGVNCIDCS